MAHTHEGGPRQSQSPCSISCCEHTELPSTEEALNLWVYPAAAAAAGCCHGHADDNEIQRQEGWRLLKGQRQH